MPTEKFSRYTDPTGQLSNQSLKLGGWYVAHKILLRNILIGILVVWSVISVGYSLIAWGSYLIDGYFADRALARRQISQFQNYATIQQNYQAEPLDFGPIQIYAPSEGKYDFVTLATNKNARFLIHLEYIFTFEGGETAVHRLTLLPQSTLPVAVLGHDSDHYPSNPSLKIQNIRFERISPHAIARVKDYLDQRLKFTAENVEFTLPQEGIAAARLKFTITNNTVFTFWEPFFYLEILSGGQPIGILSTTVADFQPGETRAIELATFIDLLGADDIRLTPVLNVFDAAVYKKP